jgi:hypothetical protein
MAVQKIVVIGNYLFIEILPECPGNLLHGCVIEHNRSCFPRQIIWIGGLIFFYGIFVFVENGSVSF